MPEIMNGIRKLLGVEDAPAGKSDKTSAKKDAPKKEKEYAFVRKRERSKSRRRSGEWKSFGIIEIKK